MKIAEFTNVYEQAKETDVISNEWFNCNMWFWLNLTAKQHIKMYNLLIEQGAKEEIQNGKTGIKLNNGCFLFKEV